MRYASGDYFLMSEINSKLPDFSQRDLINAYFDGMKEAVDFVQTQVMPILKGQINLNDRETAIVGIFYRIHALGSSLTRLNKFLDFNTVAISCRTIYELLLDLKLLSADDSTAEDVKRFHAFPRVNRFCAAQRISEFQTKNPGVEAHAFFDTQIRQNFLTTLRKHSMIESQVCSLWGTTKKGKPRWPDHWSGLSIRKRAEKFGEIYEQEYLEIYGMLSWYTHAGSTSYAGFPKDTLEGIYGFSQNISRKMYIESLIIEAKTFSLFEAIEKFSQVVEFLKDAPNKILIDFALNKLDQKNQDANPNPN